MIKPIRINVRFHFIEDVVEITVGKKHLKTKIKDIYQIIFIIISFWFYLLCFFFLWPISSKNTNNDLKCRVEIETGTKIVLNSTLSISLIFPPVHLLLFFEVCDSVVAKQHLTYIIVKTFLSVINIIYLNIINFINKRNNYKNTIS